MNDMNASFVRALIHRFTPCKVDTIYQKLVKKSNLLARPCQLGSPLIKFDLLGPKYNITLAIRFLSLVNYSSHKNQKVKFLCQL